MTATERLRLQGFPSEIYEKCRATISEVQLGAMIGNAMSVDVIEVLIAEVLATIGWSPCHASDHAAHTS